MHNLERPLDVDIDGERWLRGKLILRVWLFQAKHNNKAKIKVELTALMSKLFD